MLRLSAFLKFRGAKNLPKKFIISERKIFNSVQTSNNLDILNEHGEYAALLLLYFMTIHMAFNDSKSTQKNK